jgi:hypothetical protein
MEGSMDWEGWWTQFAFPLLLDIPNIALAVGAFIQAHDSLGSHRRALPEPMELYQGDDVTSPQDVAAAAKKMFSPLGRGSEEVPSDQVKAERVLQGWTWIFLGAFGVAVVGALGPIRYTIEHPFWALFAAPVMYVCGLVLISLRPGLLPPIEQRGRVFNFLFWPARLSIPSESRVIAFNEKVDGFYTAVEEVEVWPVWVLIPDLITDPKYDNRIMIALQPASDWSDAFAQELHNRLKKAGLRPRKLPSGGLATRFCDVGELRRVLSAVGLTGNGDAT